MKRGLFLGLAQVMFIILLAPGVVLVLCGFFSISDPIIRAIVCSNGIFIFLSSVTCLRFLWSNSSRIGVTTFVLLLLALLTSGIVLVLAQQDYAQPRRSGGSGMFLSFDFSFVFDYFFEIIFPRAVLFSIAMGSLCIFILNLFSGTKEAHETEPLAHSNNDDELREIVKKGRRLP